MIDNECLNCGMTVSPHLRQCPKCDNRMHEQHDGSTQTIDIAHNHETVREANRKLDAALQNGRQGVIKYLRVVLGSGKIREDLLGRLAFMERRGDIVRYRLETGNRGVVVIQLKR